MANEPEFSKSGVWIDRKTGKVVRSIPQHGIQIVAPGGEITRDRKAAIEAAELASKGGAPAPVEEATEDGSVVETATVKSPSRRKS